MHQANIKDRKAGMTLVELLISMGILAMVVAGATASSLMFVRVATNHENHADFHRSLTKGLEQMAIDCRNAYSFKTVSSNKIGIGSSSGNVYYTFDQSGNSISRTTGADTAQVMFNNISSMVFDTSKTDELTFAITFFVDNVGTIDSTRTLSTQFRCRN